MNEICTQSDCRFHAVAPVVDHAAGRGCGGNPARLPAHARELGRVARRLLVEPLTRTWRERRRRRRGQEEPLELDEHVLHEVGVTRVDIERLTGVHPSRQEEQLAGASSRRLHESHLCR